MGDTAVATGREQLACTLFSLKAGLVGIHKDLAPLSDMEKTIDMLTADIKNKSASSLLTSGSSSRIAELEQKIKGREDELTKLHGESKGSIARKRSFDFSNFRAWFVISIGLFIVAAIVPFAITPSNGKPYPFFLFLGLVIGFLGAIALIASLCAILYDYRSGKFNHKRQIDGAEEAIADARKYINEEQDRISQREAHRGIISAVQKDLAECEKVKADFERINLPVIAQRYADLVATHASLIHESDYENIDYLIYLFVTGRADNTKEALQLLDEERRNKRLLSAIKDASEYIVKNMQSIARALGGLIGASTMAIVSAQREGMYEIMGAIRRRPMIAYCPAT